MIVVGDVAVQVVERGEVVDQVMLMVIRAYNYRLGFFLDFTAQRNLTYLDQIDRS